MKKYNVSLFTKRKVYCIKINSFKVINFIAELPFWKIVKVIDLDSYQLVMYKTRAC